MMLHRSSSFMLYSALYTYHIYAYSIFRAYTVERLSKVPTRNTGLTGLHTGLMHSTLLHTTTESSIFELTPPIDHLNEDHKEKEQNTTATTTPTTITRLQKSLPLHVYVDNEIRGFLSMKNSERKARILLPKEIETMTVESLRNVIEKKFPSLLGEPYVLRYQLPGDIPPQQFKGE